MRRPPNGFWQEPAGCRPCCARRDPHGSTLSRKPTPMCKPPRQDQAGIGRAIPAFLFPSNKIATVPVPLKAILSGGPRNDRAHGQGRRTGWGPLCSACTLAAYALPFMFDVEAARWAFASGSGLIGARLVGGIRLSLAAGFVHGAAPAILRPAVLLILASLAAIAGCALVDGITRDAVPSEIRRMVLPDRWSYPRPAGADADRRLSSTADATGNLSR